MAPLSIWLSAAIIYALFWCWYVGFRRKITPQEAHAAMAMFDGHTQFTAKQKQAIQHFFETDDGKDFVMVNLLELKKPVRESRKKLAAYQKIFLGNLLRKAGHPVFIATAASGNIENVACDQADDWMAAGMIRYRSRRDLLEVLPDTIGSEHHDLKLESLEKTFAFPASPWMIMGGPRIVVALSLALLAALTHIVLT